MAKNEFVEPTFKFMMKKGFLIIASLLVAFGDVQAQEAVSAPKGTADPLYCQIYGGTNKSANENLPWAELSTYPWSVGSFVSIGKEFSPLWGMRGVFRYNHNKSRNVQFCESPDPWGWDNFGIFVDGTFDISDAAAPQPTIAGVEAPKWNVKAFAGIGAAYTFGFPVDVPLSYYVPYNRSSAVLFAARFGLNASWQVAPTWRMGTELSHTFFGDRFNGVSDGTPMDARTNLKVGMTYLMPNATRKPKAKQPVVMDHRLRTVPDLPLEIPRAEEVKVRKISGRAFLDFPVNETVIYPEYRRNPEELHRITSSIDSALFEKSIQVTSISLHGYASPESPYSNNTRLAKGRAAALQEYLMEKYAINRSQFTVDYTPEDWENLRNFIADGNRRKVKGDIWYENPAIEETPQTPDLVLNYRDLLLSVIDLEMDLDEKEVLLKKVGGGVPYKWLHRYVYPGLRHTDYIIEYVVRPYQTKEGKRLIYTHPEALSISEMYQVANSYAKLSDGWYDALTIAAKQYPEDFTANYNAACASIMLKRLKDAKNYIAKAGQNEKTDYLLDVIAAMEGTADWTLENGKVIVPKLPN